MIQKNKLFTFFFGLTMILSCFVVSYAQTPSVRVCQREITRQIRADHGRRTTITFNRDMLPAPATRDRESLRGAGIFTKRNGNKADNFTYACEIGLNRNILSASYEAVGTGAGNTDGYVPPGSSYDRSSDVAYRVHLANYGWTNWFKDGEQAGTTGQQRQMESIRIQTPDLGNCDLRYRVHVQDLGWSGWVREGQDAGTVGQNRRLEALEIDTKGCRRYEVEYRVHLAEFGWTDWVSDGRVAGTIGQSRAIEAVMVRAKRR